VIGAAAGVLRAPGTILFGAGVRHDVGRAAASLGGKAIVCTDPRLSSSPELTGMLESLKRAGVEAVVFDQTVAELPSVSLVQAHRRLATVPADLVIGLGGGSCIDMAKVMSLLLAHGGTVDEYYGEFTVPGPILPVIAMPTTAGTGSEATPVAVVADVSSGRKVGISDPHLIPRVAICDPELTVGCPRALTASAGADALTHLVESFTAVRRPHETDIASDRVFVGKGDLTDAVALKGLRHLGRSLLAAYRYPDNLERRADVMLGATYGGIALGTAGTAAAHALQYPLGSLTHTPHGVGVGALLPYVMRFNLRERLPEFGQVAQALGADVNGLTELEAAVQGIEAVEAMLCDLDIPRDLRTLGLDAQHIGMVAEQGLRARRLVGNNPRRLDLAATTAIVTRAYAGERTIETNGEGL
jgi:alcohol dehydrogenase